MKKNQVIFSYLCILGTIIIAFMGLLGYVPVSPYQVHFPQKSTFSRGSEELFVYGKGNKNRGC